MVQLLFGTCARLTCICCVFCYAMLSCVWVVILPYSWLLFPILCCTWHFFCQTTVEGFYCLFYSGWRYDYINSKISNRADCYAELAVSSPAVSEIISSVVLTHRGRPGWPGKYQWLTHRRWSPIRVQTQLGVA